VKFSGAANRNPDPAATVFDVTIEDSRGRRTTAEYAGIPAQRQMVVDSLKRVRPKPIR
jgi:hypothetical protein